MFIEAISELTRSKIPKSKKFTLSLFEKQGNKNEAKRALETGLHYFMNAGENRNIEPYPFALNLEGYLVMKNQSTKISNYTSCGRNLHSLSE